MTPSVTSAFVARPLGQQLEHSELVRFCLDVFIHSEPCAYQYSSHVVLLALTLCTSQARLRDYRKIQLPRIRCRA